MAGGARTPHAGRADPSSRWHRAVHVRRKRARPAGALSRTQLRARRWPGRDEVVLRSIARGIARAIQLVVRRTPEREMPDTGGHPYLRCETATRDDRARI